MDVLIAILTLALLGVAIAVISGPLRGERVGRTATEQAQAPARAELEAEREAKYREIRDAELDYRTGKLSEADYGAIDAALRSEALAILDRLERLEGERVPGNGEPRGAGSGGAGPADADGPGPTPRDA